MKKIILNSLLFFVICIMNISQALAADSETFNFVTLIDPKTKVEFERVLVPEDFNVTSDFIWARDLEEPVFLNLYAKSQKDDVFFYFASQKSYIDDEKLIMDSVRQTDSTLNIINKKYVTPEKYMTDFILKNAPDAKDITLVSSQKFQKDLTDYLNTELFKKVDSFRTKIKTDRRSSKTDVSNPMAEPYLQTYTYTSNGKKYKQTFVTMFTSIDFSVTRKTNYDFYETKLKKLWTVISLYSYRAEEKDYNNYLNDFVIFTANTMANQKAKEAIVSVKHQMVMELNPSFRDVYTGSPLRNLPSDLFRRFYEGGLAVYSEEIPTQKPSVEQIKWLTEFIAPLNGYKFVNITKMRNQKVYIPQEYSYVCYNTVKDKVYISKNKKKPKGTWVKLKIAKVNYNK